MNHLLARCALIPVIGVLAAVGVLSMSVSASTATQTPSSLSGATCAVVPSDIEFGSWEHRSRVHTCLRELAFENWAKARSEASHIDTWRIGHADLDELTAVLARYDSAGAVRDAMAAYGLLDGDGRPWVREYYGDAWKPLTGSDWLVHSGNLFSFDAETGMHPNNHDALLYELAELFGDTFKDATFAETAPHWDSQAPYQIHATLGDKKWERQAENYGDWYDVSALLDLVNEMAAATGSPDRILPLETGDQTVTVIVGSAQSLASAAAEGLIRPAGASSSMDRGKAFEEEVLRGLGVAPD